MANLASFLQQQQTDNWLANEKSHFFLTFKKNILHTTGIVGLNRLIGKEKLFPIGPKEKSEENCLKMSPGVNLTLKKKIFQQIKIKTEIILSNSLNPVEFNLSNLFSIQIRIS